MNRRSARTGWACQARILAAFLLSLYGWSVLGQATPTAIADADALETWVTQLISANPADRLQAAYFLESLDLESDQTVDGLLSLLQHEDPFVRRSAANALGELPQTADYVVNALLEAVRDPFPEVRNHAAASLAREGEAAIPRIIERLGELCEEARGSEYLTSLAELNALLFALTKMDAPVMDALLGPRFLMTEDDASVAMSVEEGLIWLSRYYPVRSLREDVILFLAGERGRDAVASLLACLEREDENARRLALKALARIGPQATVAVDPVEEIAWAGDSFALLATIALGRIGGAAEPALLELAHGHIDADVRREAVGSLEGRDAATLLVLSQILTSDPSEQVRAAAAERIGRIAGLIRDARDLSEEERTVQLDELPRAELVEALGDTGDAVREEAASALSTSVQTASPAVISLIPDFVEALTSADPTVRRHMARALERLGTAASRAAPRLMEILREARSVDAVPLPEWVGTTVSVLGSVGGQEAADLLLGMLLDPAWLTLEIEIIDALGRLRRLAEAAVPWLSEALLDCDSWWDRRTIAEALRSLGSQGVDALLEIAQDPDADESLRARVCDVLRPMITENLGVKTAFLTMSYSAYGRIRSQALRNLAVAGVATGAVLDWVKTLASEEGLSSWHGWYVDLGYYAMGASESLRGLGAAAILLMIELLRDTDVINRAGLVDLLADAGPEDPLVRQALLEGLMDPDESVRARCAARLSSVAPSAGSAVAEALEALLHRELDLAGEASDGESWQDDVGHTESGVVAAAFFALQELGASAVGTEPLLVNLLEHEDSFVRLRAVHTLAHIGPLTSVAKEALAARLADSERSVRIGAAHVLAQVGTRLAEVDCRMSAILIDEYLSEESWNVSRRAYYDFVRWYLPLVALCPTGDADPRYRYPSGLPPFPWPPPACAHKGAFVEGSSAFPRELLGTDETTLGEVHLKLENALFDVDPSFEGTLFGAPGGFVYLTRMERVHEDGEPYEDENRWTEKKVPGLSLIDIITGLFFARKGYFRQLAFVISSTRIDDYGEEGLPELEAGAADLPEDLAADTLEGKHCYVLVYSFQRRAGGAQTLYTSLSAYEHFSKSGVCSRLAGAY